VTLLYLVPTVKTLKRNGVFTIDIGK